MGQDKSNVAEIIEALKTNKNLAFSSQPSSVMEIDFCVHKDLGNTFRIDDSIYFIKYWTNDVLVDFYNNLGNMLWDEIVIRGLDKEMVDG